MEVFKIASKEQLVKAKLQHLCNKGNHTEVWTSKKGVVEVRISDRKITRIYSTINGKEMERVTL